MPQMFPGNFDLDADTEAHHDEAMPQSPNNETEVKLSCRFIMIGSYFFKPQGVVRISSDGVSIPAPRLSDHREVTVHIPLKSVVHVLTNAEPGRDAAVVMYIEAAGEPPKLRAALHMRGEAGPYFDPTSPDDAVNSIALLPVVLSRRHAAALRTLFGMVLDEPAACDARLRALRARAAHACATKMEREPSSERHGSPAQSPSHEVTLGAEPESQHKDSASSSSSVIFPPSPAPISLSSHSSHTSRSSLRSAKSSQRKRKGRGKKSKNKKPKYVLVKNPEPNPVDAFLAGVAPILKSLNPVLLNLAKSEIISAALKYERNMLTDNCINNGHPPDQFP
ncbi:uncharacterized protein [Choristoneura fumiferana]|uniref:uncharacterized protein n=1 Tax=Choristoneura fumiferana TaxID=7141 RepID=UPI003D15F000